MPPVHKYSCVNCIYLHKVKFSDFYGDDLKMEFTEEERDNIRSGKQVNLEENVQLKCFRDIWELDEYPEEQSAPKNLKRKRKLCRKEDYFFPYSPRKDLDSIHTKHERERNIRSRTITRSTGRGWKFLSLLLAVIVVLLSLIIWKFENLNQFRDWIISFIE